MQFNEQLIEVLKNFSTINPSIVFKPGTVVQTIAPMKTILAKAKTTIEFPREFGIYNLGQLLNALSLYENPDIEVESQYLTIGGGGESMQFFYCAPNLVSTPPENSITLPTVDVEFELKESALTRALKVAQTLSSPELAFEGDGDKIYLRTLESKNSSSHNWRAVVGETTKNFSLVFLMENIKLLPRDYKVEICKKGLSRFEADDVEYFVTVEAGSSRFE